MGADVRQPSAAERLKSRNRCVSTAGGARGPLPIARQAVIEHSANTHVIPGDSRIGSQLAHLRVGQIVHLSGTLVDATRDDGMCLRTSLTRTDSGRRRL